VPPGRGKEVQSASPLVLRGVGQQFEIKANAGHPRRTGRSQEL